ncbi:MAG: serine/threonine protein kinase [Proteobacteria bacterium]|nr:serine/threonine protein kinase [Pseudomonadota bacterium]MBU1716292.1 serine/threonine protein kinase [Pseudomonadota bacterium]
MMPKNLIDNFFSRLRKVTSRFIPDLISNIPGKTEKLGENSLPDITASVGWRPGDIIMDRYRIEKIMSGSMGHVFISEHLGWGVKIAIKSPRPEVLADQEGMKRILTEADAWIRMGMHPNIATCYYVLTVEKIPHIFIEYVDGGSLAEWILSGRCKDLRTALSLAVQFCHGMEYTHSKGIIHRDIKPQNVLITKNALLKITDFGILLNRKELEGKKETSENPFPENAADRESTIGFRGTPNYASPEQLRDSHLIDQRSDIFSFGLCLWLMLCGRKPFTRNDIETDIPNPLPIDPKINFPPALEELLKKCVAYHPDDRFENFIELRSVLNNLYTEIFKVPCPYAELTDIDLRADSLNNHAVSLFELGQEEEAIKSLKQTLEINDVLPEAIFNEILLKWRKGSVSPTRILRQIEAVKKRLPQMSMLDELATEVKNDMRREASRDHTKRVNFPELKLCIPPSSLDVFREGQLHHSIRRSILNHFTSKRPVECQNVLLTSWTNNGFRKDKIFTKAYEWLLTSGTKTKVVGGQRLKILKGYNCPATCLAYIPGTHKIVSAGSDGRVIIRDFGAQKKISVIEKKGRPIRSLAVSPTGKHLAIGTDDGTITVWETKSGRSFSTISQKGPVWSLAFSPDGKNIASGGAHGVLKMHSLVKNMEPLERSQGKGTLRSLTFFDNGMDLISGSEEGNLYFWEADSQECIKIIDGHSLPVVALSSGGSGKKFISAGADGFLKVWERHTGRLLKSIKSHEEAITSACLLPDLQNIVSGCEDDIIKIWDSETGECRLIFDGRGDGICSLAHGPKPHIFLAGRQDGAILLVMVIYELNFNNF